MANAKAGLQFADVLLLDTVELTFTFFQYLIRKRRKLTGRAMNENWQLMGDKSNKAMDIITSLRFNTNSPLSRANRVILPNLVDLKLTWSKSRRINKRDDHCNKSDYVLICLVFYL